jgi:trk system potassium uptake protein TrkA
MQRIGIIGAGRFGAELASGLAEKGAEVLVLDKDGPRVKSVSSVVHKAVQGDATNADALVEAGLTQCDAVVVAIGSNMESSVLSTIILKELKVPLIVAKASSDIHGKVLERVGADRVVYPNKDMAVRLARSLWAPTVLDYFEISDGVSIMEMKAPKRFVGKNLVEAKIRNVHGLTVLALRRAPGSDGKREKLVAPAGDAIINAGDTLTLFGTNQNLEKLQELTIS